MAPRKYVVTEQPFYREGRLYEPGSVVELPEGVKPGRTWTPYEEPKPAAAPSATSAEPKGKSKRPSDGDPI